MKKHLFILLFALAGASLYAQETSLTLEVVPGKLASQLTKEQKQTVTDLILTGNLNKEDFYFMRDSLPKLKNVDLKQTEVDTIPERAFYNKYMNTILLPAELKYIDEDAFSAESKPENSSVYVTGKYPGRAAYIMRRITTYGLTLSGDIVYLKISEDNQFCKEYCGTIISSDGKILYDIKDEEGCIFEEGLETIESHALVGHEGYADYAFPSTLKLIKKHAFYNWLWDCIVGFHFEKYNHHVLRMKATIPPILEQETFVFIPDDGICELIVPDGYSEIYKNANPQWEIFHIMDISVSNQFVPSSKLSISKSILSWQLSGEQIIKKVEVYDILGHLIYSQKYNNRTIEIPCMPSESILIIKVYDGNGEVETVKLNNHF